MIAAGRIAPRTLGLGMGLYALQGVVVAYLVNYNKAYMVAGGVDARLAGRVETAVLLTLVLKFLLGPLSDRYSPFGLGHRRPFIVVGLTMQTLGLLGLATVAPGPHLVGYAAMAFLAVGGLALYDTCCDGLIVDSAPPGDRPRVQALLQVARFVATMGFTLVFGIWMARSGIGPGRSGGVLVVCAVLGLPALALAFRVGSPPPSSDETFRWSALRSLGRPEATVLLIFGALYGTVGMGVEFNLSGYYADLGYGQGGVGWFGALRYGGRAAGALLLPILHRRLGRRGALVAGITALAVTTAGQAAVAGGASAGLWATAFGAACGWCDALFCVLAMEAADPAMAASTFAVYMAVANLSVVGNALFLEAVHALGHRYGAAFLLAAGLTLGLLGLVPGLTPNRPKGSLADEPA